MSIIGMAVYSTEENKKDKCLAKTLESLRGSVDFKKHRLMLSVNAYTPDTELLFIEYSNIIEKIIYNGSNIGTAEAINKIWFLRRKGEHAVKMDDDVVVNSNHDWLQMMEDVIKFGDNIGQVGLKRKDCWENPNHENPFYRSTLGNVNGIITEQCSHVMGTCVMHSDKLLNEVGYLWQFDHYGFDDSIMSLRSNLAGFKNVFIPEVDITHVDEGKTPYQQWKEAGAGKYLEIVNGRSIYSDLVKEYQMGKDVYYNPFV